MSITENTTYLLHNIRVKLYPNYLPNVNGKFVARTDNEKSLSIEDVCNALRTRGGFDGNYKDLVDYVRQYYEEVAYQLCDGYAINNGYYTIYPNIGGTFNSVKDVCNAKEHPISFRFSMREKLRDLIKNITVEIAGIADTSGSIGEFIDLDENTTNGIFIPGDVFAIHGDKIKLVGKDPSVGVYFVPVDEPSKAVKVKRIVENSRSKILGVAPDTGHLYNRIEVRTQYSGSSKVFLKTPRTIASEFAIETA